MTSFRETYPVTGANGEGLNRVNCVAYDITDGAKNIQDTPEEYEMLVQKVLKIFENYEDCKEYDERRIRRDLYLWWGVVHGRVNIVPRSMP